MTIYKNDSSNRLDFIFNNLFKPSLHLSEVEFYNNFVCIIKKKYKGTCDSKSISNYIKHSLPKYVINDWKNPCNQKEILAHLQSTIIKYNIYDPKTFSHKLIDCITSYDKRQGISNPEIYHLFTNRFALHEYDSPLFYDVLTYCITDKINSQYDIPDMSDYEKEYMSIVRKYGISG